MLVTKRKSRRGAARRTRNPEQTRGRLLDAAFGRVYQAGFQGTDLDTILAAAGVTKGALYHHFGSKEALGYAIVEERLAEITEEKWLRPLAKGGNPIDVLIGIVEGTSFRTEHVNGGCPLNNLAQEMSPLDDGFRARLKQVFRDWQSGIATALRKGQSRGEVRADVDAEETALYLTATYEGYISIAKNAQSAEVLRTGVKRVVRELEGLRGEKG